MSYSQGLHWCIMTTNIIFKQHAVLKGLKGYFSVCIKIVVVVMVPKLMRYLIEADYYLEQLMVCAAVMLAERL